MVINIKGSDDIDNEYILTVKVKPVFKYYRVYAPNEKLAIDRFISLCDKYQWLNLKEAMLREEYMIYKNDDYNYVREIL